MKSTMISQVAVEAGQASSLPARHSLSSSAHRAGRSLLMTVIALLFIAATQLQSKAQAIVPEYVPLNADQLDQLVAPIALDPDPLVAQILIGCTFPDQVGDADNWLNTKLTLNPDQRATQANSMNWDPSIKGLVIFPDVLDSLAKNSAWTTQLGNAYYNQPDDVMDAIQAMRLLAYKSQALVATAQENVVVNADLIEIVPANPDVVFVQYYNPWTVFAAEVVAYPGYVVEPVPAGVVVADGVSFEPAVSASLDFHFGFSFGGWGPGWGGGGVVYNNNVYNSNSRTVANRGHFGGHDGHGFGHDGRGFDRAGRGFDHSGRGFDHGGRGFDRSGRGMNAGYHGDPNRGLDRRSPMSRPASRGTSSPRTTPVSHSTSTGRNNSTNRAPSASRTTPSSRAASSNRSTTPSRSASTGRSVSNNRSTGQSPSAAHSQASNRSISQNRPATSPSANRSASAGRSMPASQSTSRPAPAASANQAAARSAAANRPAAANQAANRPAAASQAMNRPAGNTQAMNHAPSGGGIGGGHMGGGGGKKR